MTIGMGERRVGGFQGRGFFCSAPHPTDPDVWCRLRAGHLGDCSAFVFSISVPSTWPGRESLL